MEHRKLRSPGDAYAGQHDLEVLMSFCSAVAALEILEEIIREGATPINIATRTGQVRMGVENARRELERRDVPVPKIKVCAGTVGL